MQIVLEWTLINTQKHIGMSSFQISTLRKPEITCITAWTPWKGFLQAVKTRWNAALYFPPHSCRSRMYVNGSYFVAFVCSTKWYLRNSTDDTASGCGCGPSVLLKGDLKQHCVVPLKSVDAPGQLRSGLTFFMVAFWSVRPFLRSAYLFYCFPSYRLLYGTVQRGRSTTYVGLARTALPGLMQPSLASVQRSLPMPGTSQQRSVLKLLEKCGCPNSIKGKYISL